MLGQVEIGYLSPGRDGRCGVPVLARFCLGRRSFAPRHDNASLVAALSVAQCRHTSDPRSRLRQGIELPIDPSTAFVSYSREDMEFAVRLAKDLKAKGARVWMDKIDIRPGQRWEAEIETAVDGCSRMLVILSPAAIASPNVLAEASLALDEGKSVIPVLYRALQDSLSTSSLSICRFPL